MRIAVDVTGMIGRSDSGARDDASARRNGVLRDLHRRKLRFPPTQSLLAPAHWSAMRCARDDDARLAELDLGATVLYEPERVSFSPACPAF